jgi:hypothetical protein
VPRIVAIIALYGRHFHNDGVRCCKIIITGAIAPAGAA